VFCIFFIASPNITFENIEILNFGIGSLESLPVGILVWVIGLGLGGTTGYAINPARDLGPRIVYQFLPRKEKDADWAYSWVPVIGPIVGAVVSGLCYNVLV
jgi:glycerol uptake facilitator protein